MKKITIIFCLTLSLVLLASCGQQTADKQEDNSKSTSIIENSDDYNAESLSMWEQAGKGVGEILPEPEMEYSLPVSSDYIAAEINNATYDFFEKYVNQCINAGFEGNIGTAESPDYYFNGETIDGARVQVMYYEDDTKCSISAFPAE